MEPFLQRITLYVHEHIIGINWIIQPNATEKISKWLVKQFIVPTSQALCHRAFETESTQKIELPP